MNIEFRNRIFYYICILFINKFQLLLYFCYILFIYSIFIIPLFVKIHQYISKIESLYMYLQLHINCIVITIAICYILLSIVILLQYYIIDIGGEKNEEKDKI